MSQTFTFSFLLVAPFWFLMVLLPTWHGTTRVMRSPWVAVPAALLYTALVLPRLAEVLGTVASPTLEGVASLLATPVGVTIAWVHFLTFDLFVGRWIYLDGRERKLHPLLVSPILVLTLLLAPVGFLLYVFVRQFRPAEKVPASL